MIFFVFGGLGGNNGSTRWNCFSLLTSDYIRLRNNTSENIYIPAVPIAPESPWIHPGSARITPESNRKARTSGPEFCTEIFENVLSARNSISGMNQPWIRPDFESGFRRENCLEIAPDSDLNFRAESGPKRKHDSALKIVAKSGRIHDPKLKKKISPYILLIW